MEIVSKVHYKENLFKKWAPLLLIGAVAAFGSWFFLYMMGAGSTNENVQNSFFGEGQGSTTTIPLMVAIGAISGFFILNLKKKEIRSFHFDQQNQSLHIRYKPYWFGGLKDVHIPYTELNYQIKTEEHLGGNNKEYIIIYKGIAAKARFSPGHPFWETHRMASKKLIAKLEAVRKYVR